jgi:aminopeptidase N
LAAKALARRHDAPTISLLSGVLNNPEVTYLLRIECARALGKIPAPESLTALVAATHSERAEVRRAVATALGQFRSPQVLEPLTDLATQDPSYLVQSDACRALGQSRHAAALGVLRERLTARSWADVVRAGAVDGLASLHDEAEWPLLREQTRYGNPSRVRRAAIAALGRVATDRATRDHMERLLDDSSPHIRAEVVDALVALGQPEALGEISRRLTQETDPGVQRHLKEALRDLDAKEPQATKRLNEQVTEMKRQLLELETKCDRLASTAKAGELENKETEPTASATKRGTARSSKPKAKAGAKPKAKPPTRTARSRRKGR